jgi:cytochrome c oxidase subunit 1
VVARVRAVPTRVPALALSPCNVEAEPDLRHILAGPSLWPLLAALATTALFIGSIFNAWAIIWGAIPLTVTLIGWFWPTTPPVSRRAPA